MLTEALGVTSKCFLEQVLFKCSFGKSKTSNCSERPGACLQMKVYADGYTLCGKIFSRVSPVFPLFSNSARASSVVFPFIRASGWAKKLAKRI